MSSDLFSLVDATTLAPYSAVIVLAMRSTDSSRKYWSSMPRFLFQEEEKNDERNYTNEHAVRVEPVDLLVSLVLRDKVGLGNGLLDELELVGLAREGVLLVASRKVRGHLCC